MLSRYKAAEVRYKAASMLTLTFAHSLAPSEKTDRPFSLPFNTAYRKGKDGSSLPHTNLNVVYTEKNANRSSLNQLTVGRELVQRVVAVISTS